MELPDYLIFLAGQVKSASDRGDIDEGIRLCQVGVDSLTAAIQKLEALKK